MNRWTQKLLQILSWRSTGFTIIALVTLCRALQLVYFFNTRNDMTFQVLGAENLLNGHGINSATVLSSDLSQTIYQPLTQWPPGYSILFIPFYLLLGKSYIAAALTLSILCAIILIFVSRSVLKLLEVPYPFINLFTLLSGFFGYSFYTKPCTDAIGITFLLVAIYFLLKLISSKGSSFKNATGLAGSLLLAGFIKYLFVPVIFLIPAFVIIKGVAVNSQRLKKTGSVVFTFLFLVFTCFFLYQRSVSGSVAYIKEPERGFFPENLNATFPVITNSFIKTDSIEQLMPGQMNTGAPLLIAFQWISLLIFGILLVHAIRILIRSRLKHLPLQDDLFLAGVFVSFVIIAILVTLSLTVAKELYDFGVTWTYVEEARYYGIITVLLHIGVFTMYPAYISRRKKWLKFLFPVLLLLMTPEATRGILFSANRILHVNKETYGWQYELGIQKKADTLLKQIREKETDRQVVVTGSSDWMRLRISLYSHLPAWNDVTKLLVPHELKTSKPVTLFVQLRDDHVNNFKSFISLPAVQNEGAENGYSYFSYRIDP